MSSSEHRPVDVVAALELIDFGSHLSSGADAGACVKLTESLREYGAALIVDPRLRPGSATAFRDLMERYFGQPREAKMADARPDVFYQVGATPDGVERPRVNESFVDKLVEPNLPVSQPSVAARKKDPKWRFFWRIGDRPAEGATRFPQLNAPQVVPAAFAAEWAPTMDAFGRHLLSAVETAAEMLARGLGLPARTFADKLEYGPHLLAPTGADMSSQELSAVGATLAGLHYDLNFITCHAAGRFGTAARPKLARNASPCARRPAL
jgi:isopenicillin N synthase-like dioxygenase